MSDNSSELAIVLKLIQQGDFKNAEAELKRISEATKQDTEHTTKNTEAKHKFREALHGVALKFPELTHALRLFINPIGAAIGAIAVLISKIHEFHATMRLLADAGREFQRLYAQIDPVSVTMRKLVEDGERQAEMLLLTTDRVAKLNERYTELANTQTMLLQLNEKLGDAELAAEMERIDASNKPESEKVMARMSATAAARRRGTIRDQQAAEGDIANTQLAAGEAGKLAGSLNKAADELTAEIAQQKQIADFAKQTAENTASFSDKLIAENTAAANEWANAKPGQISLRNAGHVITQAEIDQARDYFEETLQSLKDSLKETGEEAAKEAQRLADLQKLQETYRTQASAAQDKADELNRSAAEKRSAQDTRDRFGHRIENLVTVTEVSKAGREAQHIVDEQRVQAAREQAEQLRSFHHGESITGGPVVDNLQALREELSKRDQKYAREIQRILDILRNGPDIR
jgi:hypothetical protein